jgi:MOSC domain-containing protein YiiM
MFVEGGGCSILSFGGGVSWRTEPSMPHVVSLAYKPSEVDRRPANRFSRVVVDHVTLVAGFGVAGDAKGRADSRQLNVLLAETVEQLRSEGFHTAPGELGEQVVITGLAEIVPGNRLQIGESAVVELVYFRVPCSRFARIQGQSKDLVRGRLGFMARVLVSGEVGVGDPVSVVAADVAADS